MKLKVIKENKSGLNEMFVNVETNRKVTLEHAINQIEKGNKNYSNYETAISSKGNKYIRSKPDGKKSNNIE